MQFIKKVIWQWQQAQQCKSSSRKPRCGCPWVGCMQKLQLFRPNRKFNNQGKLKTEAVEEIRDYEAGDLVFFFSICQKCLSKLVLEKWIKVSDHPKFLYKNITFLELGSKLFKIIGSPSSDFGILWIRPSSSWDFQEFKTTSKSKNLVFPRDSLDNFCFVLFFIFGWLPYIGKKCF